MSSGFFWFVYFTLAHVYKVKAVKLLDYDTSSANTSGNYKYNIK